MLNGTSIWAKGWFRVLLLLLAGARLVHAQAPVDSFAARGLLTGSAGTVAGSNVGATVEPDEPRHGGKAPSRSMWIRWQAPASGLVKFEVEAQDFDVLLGVYRLKAGAPAALKSLEKVAQNDDGRCERAAEVEFGTRAGEYYEIAMDGFARSSGAFVLKWQLEALDAVVPVIINGPADQSYRLGNRVVLFYAVEEADDVKLHWFFNDIELEDQEGPTLVLPSLTEAQVGQYRLRVDVDRVRFFTEPVEVQLTTEGDAGTLARNKPEDAMESPLVGSAWVGPVVRRGAAPAGDGVSRGYSGSQVFNTVYAGRDPAEPVHCGRGTGASYWFAYVPPAAGTLSVDTVGSSFDTVLAVYTYELPYLGYASLRNVECDDNSGPDGTSSRLRFAAQTDRPYLVVVDGVNGAKGRARLNYLLETNLVPVLVAPRVISTSKDRVVPVGMPVSLSAEVEGSPPLTFRWLVSGSTAVVTTNALLDLGPAVPAFGGTYRLEVANAVGSVTSAPVAVTVWSSPVLTHEAAGGLMLRYHAAGPARVALEATPDLTQPWSPWTTGEAGVGGLVQLPVDPAITNKLFWRLNPAADAP